nr:hypothetical protein [Allomuricauda algicola]
MAKNKQANPTQKWQLDYFYEISNSTDFKKVSELCEMKRLGGKAPRATRCTKHS